MAPDSFRWAFLASMSISHLNDFHIALSHSDVSHMLPFVRTKNLQSQLKMLKIHVLCVQYVLS